MALSSDKYQEAALNYSAERLNTLLNETKCLSHHLSIEFLDTPDGQVKAKMPVVASTKQPFGILHGGASAALAETVGSVAAHLSINDETKTAVGASLVANHLRPVDNGWVYATAKAVHLGSKTQVWDIEIVDEKDRLVSTSRLTVAIIDKP